ncbi:MAG: hypothetical protein IT260_09025 [Saprospiraceae bacterium]|nr:hypothetical protein [Saprospiraceae bacterium]
MRLTIAFLLAFTAILSPLQAQYEDLLRQRHVTWMAEYTADYELNPVYNANLDTENNLLDLIRLQALPESELLNQSVERNFSFFLSQLLYNSIAPAQAGTCFADAALQHPLNETAIRDRLSRIDTVTAADPETGLARVMIVRNDYRPEEIVLFRVRQVLYYHKGRKAFGSRILAVAPVLEQRDAEGNVTALEPLLWLKMPTLSEKARAAAWKTAGYAVQTFSKDNTPAWQDLRVLKGKLDLQAWAATEVRNPTHPVALYQDSHFVPANQETLQGLIFTQDTLTAVGDNGFVEIAGVEPRNALLQVEKLRLVQNWYFDPRRRLLECRLVAVSPLATVRDADGQPRYDKPLFYLRY